MQRLPTARSFLGRRSSFAPAPAEPPRLLLTPPEAATALRLSARTLWALTKDGKIPHLRVGRQIRYSVMALEEWITKQIAAAPVPAASKPAAASGDSVTAGGVPDLGAGHGRDVQVAAEDP